MTANPSRKQAANLTASAFPAVPRQDAGPAAPARQAVLFISHTAERNGAPLILLRFIRWIKEHTNLEIHILLRRPGELTSEFESVGSVFHVPRFSRFVSAALGALFGKSTVARIEDLRLRGKVRRLNPALIYSNTITNPREIMALAPLRIPTLCHVHEMEWICREFGLENAIAAAPFIQRFISVATPVGEHLVRGIGVRPESIDTVREFSWSASPVPEKRKELRDATRSELGLDKETFVVGGCGTIEWRKGIDLFLAVAKAVSLRCKTRRFRFIWVGGPTRGVLFEQLQHDAALAGISDMVTFVGSCPSPEKYYAAMDAFALTSREDPCPLSMIEAAHFTLPIACFEGSGGAAEFVSNGAGIAVPYLDVERMANALLTLDSTPELRSRLGAAARERAQLNHDPDTQCAKLFEAMIRTQPPLAGAARPVCK